MSQAEHLTQERLWCGRCRAPAKVRVFSMNLVGLDRFRGVDEGQTVRETRDHWIEQGKKAGLDPQPVDQTCWT